MHLGALHFGTLCCRKSLCEQFDTVEAENSIHHEDYLKQKK